MKNIDKKLNRLEMFLIHYENLSKQHYHMTLSTNYTTGTIDEVYEIEELIEDYKKKAQRVCKYLREHYKDIEKNDEFERIITMYDFVYYSRHFESI